MPPWEAFCTKRCGLYQDFYLVLWDDPVEMLAWEERLGVGPWIAMVFLGWLEWPGGTGYPWFDADFCRYIALIVHILFVLAINGAYITSLKPRTDYSFVQNGSDVKGATWEPDECLPISLDHIRLRLKLDWVETLFQYMTARIARNTTCLYLFYDFFDDSKFYLFKCLVLFDEPPILLSGFLILFCW